MTIFWRLILAHFIADFTLQTNKVAEWKRVSQMGMGVHVIAHPLMSMLLAWPFLGDIWVTLGQTPLTGWACVGIITLIHWVEDEFRIWAIRKEIVADGSAFLAWDQAVHLGSIYLFSPARSGGPGEVWVLVALCAVLLTHVTSVVIYFLETDSGTESAVLGPGKYRLMAERLMGGILVSLPGYFTTFGFVWVAAQLYRQTTRRSPRTWVHTLTTCTAVLVLGLIARKILF